MRINPYFLKLIQFPGDPLWKQAVPDPAEMNDLVCHKAPFNEDNAKACLYSKKHHPLYINTHFNHPNEITAESTLACTMLADSGIPVGCQTIFEHRLRQGYR